MYDRYRFYTGLMIPNFKFYCGMIDYLVGISDMVETSRTGVELVVNDKAIAEIIRGKCPELDKGKMCAPGDLLLEIGEKNAPPYSHFEIMNGKYDRLSTQEILDNTYKYDKLSNKNYLSIPLTMKYPDQMPIQPSVLLDMVDNFESEMLKMLPHRNFIADELETTRTLLKGEDDIILPQTRTMTIKFPLHDVTNSIQLLKMREFMKGSIFKKDGFDENSHFFILEFEGHPCFHLFVFHFLIAANKFEGAQFVQFLWST